MQLSQDQIACFASVQKSDPDRFMAIMSAPLGLRVKLAPLYAFNVEVARAPWVTQEPMIGEMRLQWWRDVLEEIAQGGPVRRHEVATPLSHVLDQAAAQALDASVEARRWDLYKEAFEDEAAFWAHLEATGAELLWQAARIAGADETMRSAVIALGRAQALTNWFMAVPALEKSKRIPLVDGRPEAVAALAQKALADLKPLPTSKDLRGVLCAAWMAKPLLRQVAQEPSRVIEGEMGLSPFAKKLRLVKASLLGL